MKKYLLLFFISVSVILNAKVKPPTSYGSIKVSRVIKVYDGDTFKVDIDGYPEIIGKNISIRVANIDTAELRSKNQSIKKIALDAKTFTKNFLENGSEIILKNIRRGKYFRIVADVLVDGKSLSIELIKKGLALPYNGRKKPKWEHIVLNEEFRIAN